MAVKAINTHSFPSLVAWVSRRPVLPVVLTGAACLLSGMVAYGLVDSPLAPALLWPAGGIALAAGMLWGLRVTGGAALGVALSVLIQGEDMYPALLLALASVAQIMVGLVLLRLAKVTSRLSEVSDLLQMVLYGGLVAGLVAMPLGFLALQDVDGFWELPLSLQVSSLVFTHFISVLIFGALILCLLNSTCPPPRASPLERWLALFSVCLLALFLAHPELLGMDEAPLRPYPVLPFLLWLALRADTRFVALIR